MKILVSIPIEITLELVLKEMQVDYKTPRKRIEKRWKKEVIENLIEKSKNWIRPCGVYDIFTCRIWGNQLILNGGKAILTSSSLVKIMGSSKNVGLLVVTIGEELERNIKYFSSPEDVILEAIGSAAANECAEYIHRQIIDPLIKEFQAQETIRRSPGYGFHKNQDWDVIEQRVIFNLLHPEQKPIKVALTPNYQMVPRKSVSAIVGIKS